MGRVLFKPAAEKDLAHSVHFLASQSSETASQFHSAVEDTCAQLAESPELGGLAAPNSAAIADVRVWRVGRFRNFLIFYRSSRDGIEVIRILHAARDWLQIVESSSE